eukprot:6191707-Pleurochrysis_carterae.AAC.2
MHINQRRLAEQLNPAAPRVNCEIAREVLRGMRYQQSDKQAWAWTCTHPNALRLRRPRSQNERESRFGRSAAQLPSRKGAAGLPCRSRYGIINALRFSDGIQAIIIRRT